jgi:hypothetical protein
MLQGKRSRLKVIDKFVQHNLERPLNNDFERKLLKGLVAAGKEKRLIGQRG